MVFQVDGVVCANLAELVTLFASFLFPFFFLLSHVFILKILPDQLCTLVQYSYVVHLYRKWN